LNKFDSEFYKLKSGDELIGLNYSIAKYRIFFTFIKGNSIDNE